MAERTDRRRRTFVPVVLAGLATAALAAVAGHQPWAQGSGDRTTGFSTLSATVEAGRVPAANALALVVLACWGVLLVTRRRVRRVASLLGALAAVGVLVTAAVGFRSAPDGVRHAYAELGVDSPDVSRTWWYWVAVVAAVLTVATTVAALRLVGSWPEMGSRYDAPASEAPATGAQPEPVVPPEEQESLDLWKAMDEGRDPTA